MRRRKNYFDYESVPTSDLLGNGQRARIFFCILRAFEASFEAFQFQRFVRVFEVSSKLFKAIKASPELSHGFERAFFYSFFEKKASFELF